MLAFVATTALWAQNNVITYTADQKLTEGTGDWNKGLHPNAFNVAITSHTFSNGKGTITFAGELTTIEKFAFYGCRNILSLTIPNSVTSIGEYAFYMVCNVEYNGTAQSSTNWDAKCLNGYIENNLVYSDATKTKLCGCPSFVFGAMIIPNTVITIGREAFAYCDGISSVTIPNSVTTIEYGAFDGISKVTELTIPASVTSIADQVFRSWSESLTTIRVEDGNPNYDSRNDCNALIETATNTLLLGCVNTVIPNTITVIGEYAFNQCENLTSVIIPASVTEIEMNAFCDCGLTEITLPGSLEEIGGQAFYRCELTKITCLATTPPVCTDGSYSSLSGIDRSIPVYVPKGSIAAYQSAKDWKEFTNIQAYTKNYGLYVKGEQVTFDNCGDILGDGTVSYDEISNTLTLNNANITYDGTEVIAIYQDLTIICIGNNTLTTNTSSCILNDVGSVTITGSGTLSLVSNADPAIVEAQGGLTITGGCTVTAQSATFSAISLFDEPLTIDNATLIAKGNGKDATILACANLVLNNAAITSAHTYDAATHKFLDAAGNEAKDDIIIGVAGTGLEELTVDNAQGTNKFIHNGQLLIKHNGKLFNALGGRVK